MPDEVKDMPGAVAQSALQIAPRPAFDPFQFEQTAAAQIGQGAFQTQLFDIDIQLRQVGVARAGEHAQYAQRRLDEQRLAGLGQVDITHQGRLLRQADIFALPGVVEQFPGQGGQLRGADMQAQAQPFALSSGLRQADIVARTHFAHQQRLEQSAAELLHGVFFGCGRTAFAQHTEQGNLEFILVAFQGDFVEGKLQSGARLARRRAQHR